MDWIKIKDCQNARAEMPQEKQFLAIWKGAVCLCQFDEIEEVFAICYYPASYESFVVSPEREIKFTHWAEIPLPEDY